MPESDEGSTGVIASGKRWLWEVLAGILSLLFPQRCAGCDRIDISGFCVNCLAELEWLDPDEGCKRCGAPVGEGASPAGRTCGSCRKRSPRYTRAVAALRYTGPLVRAVVEWKYHDCRGLSRHLAKLLCGWVSSRAPKWWEEIQAIVPAPHHVRTVRQRGFAPPEDLARLVSETFAVPSLPRVLFKIRHTPPQTRLSAEARRINVHLSMKVFDPSLVEGKTILVIDDVMTTGATMNECARALMEAGAKRIYGLVLARQAEGKQ